MNKAVGKIFITIIGVAILLAFNLLPAFSQEIIPLSPEKQEQVDRYKELVSRYKLANNNQQTVFYLNKIAFIYWENGSLKDAIQYFLESIPFYEKINNYADIKTIYSNVALIYSDLERLDLALEYFLKSLEVRRKLNDKQELAAGLIDVAYLYTALNQAEKAIPLLEEAFALSKLINNPRLTVNCLRLLSTNYDKLGNIAKAKEYNDLYQVYEQQLATQEIKTEYESKVLKSETETEREREQRRAQAFLMELNQLKAKAKEDSLSYEVRTRQERALKAEEEASRRQMEIDYLNKDKELQATRFREQQAKSRIQQIIIYSALGFLLLMLILAIIIFKNYRDKKKANELLSLQNIEIQNQRDHIQRQNENINKSINYAQGIQKALLPPQSSLAEIFPESFIFFRPRDIVSGDYYWFRPLLNGEEKNGVATKFAVSAIDCTGHGVPGAFLSMIGYNLLDEIVSKGIHNPGTILKELNNGIRRTLRQDETDNRDGMDMALCIVDKKKRIVEFSGAKNPVVYVVNNEVFRIRGDKESIGGGYGYMENDFTTHQIPIEGPTWFYVFSDGFIDQFGGADGRKFMIKGFVDLLASISILPAAQQREMLKNTLKDWLGTQYQQVDDILVVGFMVE